MAGTVKSDFEVIRRNKVYEEVARQIERLLRGGLHPRGEFVAGDARFQVGLAGMTCEMIAIEAGEEGEVLFLQLAFEMRRRFQV